MFRRLFWLFLGVGVGMGSSWWVTRRVKQVAARYTPERLSNDMASSVRALGRDVRLVDPGRPRGDGEARGGAPRATLPVDQRRLTRPQPPSEARDRTHR